jgi:hypothetical protein
MRVPSANQYQISVQQPAFFAQIGEYRGKYIVKEPVMRMSATDNARLTRQIRTMRQIRLHGMA